MSKQRFITIIVLLLLIVGVGATWTSAQDMGSIYNPSNGHTYQIIYGWLTWDQANHLASQAAINNCTGHMATITSEGENIFLVQNFGDTLERKWLGGFQEPGVYPADYGWQWVTGESFTYTNFDTLEPNDAFGPASEQVLQIYRTGYWNDAPRLDDYFAEGYILEYECPLIEVAIDIYPNRYPNIVYPNITDPKDYNGLINVSVLTTPDFDARTVDPTTVRFGPAGASAIQSRGVIKDVDRDGDVDITFGFRIVYTGIKCGDTSASLSGSTFDGQHIYGTDSIQTQDCTPPYPYP